MWNCQNTSQFQSSPLLLLLHLLLPLLLQLSSLLPLPSDNLAIAFAVALTIAIDIDHTLRCTACISDRRLFIALPTRFRCLHAYANRFYSFLRPELSCFAPNPTPTSYHQSDHLSTISIVPSNVPSNIPSNVPSNATSNFPSSVPSNQSCKASRWMYQATCLILSLASCLAMRRWMYQATCLVLCLAMYRAISKQCTEQCA